MFAFSTLLAIQLGASPPELERLLQAARAHNHQLGISRAQLAEQRAAVEQALSVLLPSLTANVSYTRNQYAANLTVPNNLLGRDPPNEQSTLTIQPFNAWQASGGLNVPILSASNIFRYDESKHGLDAAQNSEKASESEVLLSTARAYYQVVGAQGVVQAAERAVTTAQESLRVTQVRLSAGTTNRLAVARAEVDLARARQTVVTGRQTLAVAQRTLETLTGVPINAPLPPPQEPEMPSGTEADYVARAEASRPELGQAQAVLSQQEVSLREAWSQLVPVVSGSALEHFTNAPGFTPAEEFWILGANLSWTVEPLGIVASVKHAHASIEEQQERLAQEHDTIRDDVHTAWLDVEADKARLDEAISEARSASEALTITKEQFKAGTATSLDISQSQRDAFNADARLAQAQADLASALLALKKAAGESLLDSEGGAP